MFDIDPLGLALILIQCATGIKQDYIHLSSFFGISVPYWAEQMPLIRLYQSHHPSEIPVRFTLWFHHHSLLASLETVDGVFLLTLGAETRMLGEMEWMSLKARALPSKVNVPGHPTSAWHCLGLTTTCCCWEEVLHH